ncbi:MAG: alpha/beta fold hydrolase [Candidatus Binataceae bacterium]
MEPDSGGLVVELLEHGSGKPLVDGRVAGPRLVQLGAEARVPRQVPQVVLQYSMGGRITLEVLMRDPERLSAIVLGGYGEGGPIATPGQRHRIAAALLAEDPAVIEDVLARRFRRGAERNGKDLRALAACIGAEETTDAESALDYEALRHAASPVLIATGDRDTIAGDPQPLKGWFRDARVALLEGADHVSLPADARFHQAVEDFLATAAEE